MTEIIKITENNGQQAVSARELYISLGYDLSHYSRWAKSTITESPFFIENEDWAPLAIDGEPVNQQVNPTKDYALSITMAKKIAMMAKTEVGNKIRDYFIECEKKSAIKVPKTFREALLLAAEQQLLIEQQAKQIELKDTVIAEYEPKVSYYDMILSSKDAINITVIAKDYGMSGKALNKLLNDLDIIYNSGGTWLPYQKYASCGYTKTSTVSYNNGDGSSVHSKWTQKGRLFLYDLLKKNNVLPLIEQ